MKPSRDTEPQSCENKLNGLFLSLNCYALSSQLKLRTSTTTTTTSDSYSNCIQSRLSIRFVFSATVIIISSTSCSTPQSQGNVMGVF